MEAGPWTKPDTPSNVTAASVLSFVSFIFPFFPVAFSNSNQGASIVGFGLGWCSYAADYTVNFPEKCVS